MPKHPLILNSVYKAIDEINNQRSKKNQLDKIEDTVLMGSGGKLDSLGLVNLIYFVEDEIDEDFKTNITIVDEKLFAQEKSPLKTVGTLVEYIGLLLEESE